MTSNHHSHHHQRAKGRRLTACHRHPDEPFASLCAACLRERLSLLNPPPASASTSASADEGGGSSSAAGAAALPQLRRCRTFSANRCENLGLTGEPRRRSCEVRARSTLEDLFAADEEAKGADGGFTAKSEVGSRNPGLLRGTYPVPELREEEDGERDCEIRVCTDVIVPNNACEQNADEEEDIENSKTMKEFIDLEVKGCKKPARRDLKVIAGSFRSAASVFSRKLQIWKRKQQKIGRPDSDYDNGGGGGGGMSTGRRFRDTQSEVGEYRSGRRSCDTDPRVSIDLSRASIDGGRYSVDGIGRRFDDADPRCSLDLGRDSVDCGRVFVEEERYGCFVASRASCDGYMNGKPIPQGTTPTVSVIENAMATIYGFDNREMVAKKLNRENRERRSSSGYRHLDSLSLLIQKKGFDRSNSKRNEMLTREEDGEMQPASCSKKLPGEIKTFRDAKLLITEKELMGSRMSSLKDDSSDCLDTASKHMTSSASSSSSSSSSSNGFHKPRR